MVEVPSVHATLSAGPQHFQFVRHGHGRYSTQSGERLLKVIPWHFTLHNSSTKWLSPRFHPTLPFAYVVNELSSEDRIFHVFIFCIFALLSTA